MNKRALGTDFENIVCDFLSKHNVTILEHSFHCKIGEIDLIGQDGDTLVFFEVKYRSRETYGHALEAVTPAKQKKISKVSDYYRLLHKINETQNIRYDVVAIQARQITWIRNAFLHYGYE